LHATNYVK